MKMSKRKKKKEDELGYLIIGILFIIIIVISVLVISSIKNNKKIYEYALDGQIYQSNKCYQKDNGDCYCMNGYMRVRVDSYYEI